jgi:hypothetical protein
MELNNLVCGPLQRSEQRRQKRFASIAGLHLLHNQPPRNTGICRQFGVTPAIVLRGLPLDTTVGSVLEISPGQIALTP